MVRSYEELQWERARARERLRSAVTSGAGAGDFAYDEARRSILWPHISGFAEYERWAGLRVLELGCGTGLDAVKFLQHGAIYTGVAITEAEVNAARKRLASQGLEGTVHLGSLENLETLRNQEFDLVIAIGSIQQPSTVTSVGRAVERLLARTGELRLMLLAKQSWWEVLEADQAPISRVIEKEKGESIASGRGEIRKLLEGYEVVRVAQAGLPCFQKEKEATDVFELEPWFASMSRPMLSVLEERMGVHLLVQACKPEGRKRVETLARKRRKRELPSGILPPPEEWAPAPNEPRGDDHPIFAQFQPYSGPVPEGFKPDFIGTLINRNYSAGEFVQEPSGKVRPVPARDEEYFEWIDVLESVASARGSYTMLEVGAGYGRWSCRAALAARQRGLKPLRIAAVEAEPSHRQWIEPHYRTNGLTDGEFRIFPVAVAAKPGTAFFYINEPGSEDPAKRAKDWYGQMLAGNDKVVEGAQPATYHGLPVVTFDHGYQAVEVEVAAFNDILKEFDVLDLVDFDIQGREFEVIESSIAALDAKARMVHVGTHGRDIEVALRALFLDHGWLPRYDYSCFAKHETPYGVISFQDGVQSWSNPRFNAR